MARLLALVCLALVLGACVRTRPITTTAHADEGTVTSGDVLFSFAPGTPRVDAVYLTGDFTGWQPTAIPMRDPEADGVWTISRAFEPGIYQYQFVTTGARWYSDPARVTPEGLIRRSDVRELTVSGIRGW